MLFLTELGFACYFRNATYACPYQKQAGGGSPKKALRDLADKPSGCMQGLLLPQQPTQARVARGVFHLPDSSDSMLRPEPECGCWSESWAPPHCSRAVRGLKERHRKVRTHSRIRERSTMPRATGGESGSSLTFKTGGRKVRMNTAWVFIAFYFYIYRNQIVRFKFKAIKSDGKKALALLPPGRRTCSKDQRDMSSAFTTELHHKREHSAGFCFCVIPQQAS